MHAMAEANILNGLLSQRIEALQILLLDFEIQCLLKVKERFFFSFFPDFKVIYIHCRKVWKVVKNMKTIKIDHSPIVQM